MLVLTHDVVVHIENNISISITGKQSAIGVTLVERAIKHKRTNCLISNISEVTQLNILCTAH